MKPRWVAVSAIRSATKRSIIGTVFLTEDQPIFACRSVTHDSPHNCQVCLVAEQIVWQAIRTAKRDHAPANEHERGRPGAASADQAKLITALPSLEGADHDPRVMIGE